MLDMFRTSFSLWRTQGGLDVTAPLNTPLTLPADNSEPIHLGPHSTASEARVQLIRFLQHLPNVAEGLKKMAPSDTFRVIMSSENAKFFKQAADGTYKPFLHDGKKFIENVNLKKVSPNLFSAASSFLLTVNMAAIAADLSAIKIGVRDIGTLIADSARGEVYGSISSLRQAKALEDPFERRRETLGACRDLSIRLGKLAGQLKAHCGAMPEPKTGIFDGFFGSGLEEADAKWREVEQDLLLLRDGVSALLETYGELGEPGAAREALTGVLKAVVDADLPNVARKARLVRVSRGSPPPEKVARAIHLALGDVQKRVLTSASPLLLSVVIDITPEEFDTCQTVELAPVGGS
jgi:hypothetical protein